MTTCRRAPPGAKPQYNNEYLPIEGGFHPAAWVMPPYSKVFDIPINSNLKFPGNKGPRLAARPCDTYI
jgi:hypothetical protein